MSLLSLLFQIIVHFLNKIKATNQTGTFFISFLLKLNCNNDYSTYRLDSESIRCVLTFSTSWLVFAPQISFVALWESNSKFFLRIFNRWVCIALWKTPHLYEHWNFVTLGCTHQIAFSKHKISKNTRHLNDIKDAVLFIILSIFNFICFQQRLSHRFDMMGVSAYFIRNPPSSLFHA